MGKQKRRILRIDLDPQATEFLETLCSQRGMTRITAISRLVQWFTNLDDGTRAALLNIESDQQNAELRQELLKQLSTKKDQRKRPENGKG